MHKKQEEGFSLILVAILLVVAAMVATTALQESKRDGFWNPRVDTQKNITNVQKSLQRFQRAYGYFPCPAAMNTLPTASTFGEATDCTAGAVAGQVWEVDNGSGEKVRIGLLPVLTLKMPRDAASDSFGGRLLYAVSKKLTSSSTFDDGMGVITVNDAAGNPQTSEATFVILSHGQDGKGSYRYATAASRACATAGTAADQENCDYLTAGDTVFTASRMYLVSDANYYDDQVLWGEVVSASGGSTDACLEQCVSDADISTTPLDDGSFCVSAGLCMTDTSFQTSLPWNDGGTPGTITATSSCTSSSWPTASTTCWDGAGNTAALASSSDSQAPYQAAKYCADLSAHGHSDWYLGAPGEVTDSYAKLNPDYALYGIDVMDWYWSSARNGTYAWVQRVYAAGAVQADIDNSNTVRCLRRVN